MPLSLFILGCTMPMIFAGSRTCDKCKEEVEELYWFEGRFLCDSCMPDETEYELEEEEKSDESKKHSKRLDSDEKQ